MDVKITIGIPVYNEGKYLALTIESVLKQDYSNFNLLIIDDCSIDNSLSIAEYYEKLDPRVKVYKNSPKKTFLENWEAPLRGCNTKYFIWLGGHDIITPDYLFHAISILENDNTIAMAYPGAITIDADGNFIKKIIDNYDTKGLSLKNRILKIARNYNDGYVIHGVFRTKIAQKLPFEKVFGFDFLMLLATTRYGHIVRIPRLGFQRREIRKETQSEQIERHASLGIFQKVDSNPFNLLASTIHKYILDMRDISIIDRIYLVIRLKNIFENKFQIKKVNYYTLFSELGVVGNYFKITKHTPINL